jgi:uncharacterized protein YjbI with pentapeptide repeats
MSPDLPADLAPAALPGDDLADGGVYVTLAFTGLDLSGREAMDAEVDQCLYRDVDLSQVGLRRAAIRDAMFERCDLANLRARDCAMSRTAIGSSRMTGFCWLAGDLRDVTFDDCRIDLASFSGSKFSDVVFTSCRLEQADFGGTDLSRAIFERCDLSGAQFSGARMTGTRLSGCDLTGINGITSLRGATIASTDALALAALMASALGITIEDH